MSDNNIPFGLKVTPLFEFFKEKGATFTDFGGYYMPVNFSEGIIKEHKAVRTTSGLFDISHMGEIRIKGKDASGFLNYVSSNNINKTKDQRMQYNIIMQEDGGAIDDLMVYKFNSLELLLVCNAANKDVLFNHLIEVNNKTKFNVEIIDESADYAAIAVQGPLAERNLSLVLNSDLKVIKYLEFKDINNLLISRSGYTGEDGFEIYGKDEDIVKLTKSLVENDVAICGLGARDTLRFEAGLPLFGHELSNYISPLQAGMGFAI